MSSIFSIFKRGLQKSTTSISRSLAAAFSGVKGWDQDTYDELENALIAADFGVKAATRIVAAIRDRYERGQIQTTADITEIACADIVAVLGRNRRPINFAASGPTVILMVGVNGSGKTTTIGKLTWHWKQQGRKVMLAACDTFRAAASEQLKLWGKRTDSPVIASRHGADPSAVAFDAVQSAQARNADILFIDTAGRQHTHKGLMDELAKMRRTVDKVSPGAPHEVWLTVDASLGSNAINQAREFTRTAGVTGLVLTKLDGTGKGGMAAAIQEEFDLPVFFVGLGEQPDDLQPFDPELYARALFGRE
ncbi:MAG: signal recognition particle-docking protein FtsY [Victivallales bacterium]|nr:signal recognition particle-docking protein FtsY [Victivallales bacterium]